MDSEKEIISLLKSLELHIVKLENKILILENKIDSLNKKPSTPFGTDLSSIQPPFHPNFPIFPSKPF